MKRSEMVSLIFKRLGPIGISEPSCEEVLVLIEKAGMCPPGYSGLQANGKKYNADTDSGRDVMWVRGKWEPEDG